MSKLHLNTISSPLGDALVKIMQTSAFNPFYLAGGTALSLQRGHRQSIDIDLFTDIEYGTLNTTGLSDVICLKNKYWEFIVEDLMDAVANL